MFQRVARAVHPRPLAVPQPEHALDLAVGIGLDLLRAKNRRRRKILVDRGQELDPQFLGQLPRPPHL